MCTTAAFVDETFFTDGELEAKRKVDFKLKSEHADYEQRKVNTKSVSSSSHMCIEFESKMYVYIYIYTIYIYMCT